MDISNKPFVSDLLESSFKVFLSIFGLYQVFKSTSPANINQNFSESFKNFSNSLSSMLTVILGSLNFLFTVSS